MIEAVSLTKTHRGALALDHVSYTFEAGSLYGVLGQEGAGKTALLHLLTGTKTPDEGLVRYEGEPLSLAHRGRMGYLPEGCPLYGSMTPWELLLFVGEAKRLSPETLFRQAESALEATDTEGVRDRLIASLSEGEKRRVGLASTLLGTPQWIVLDEPTRGLPREEAEAFCSLLSRLSKHVSLLVATKDPSLVAICEHVIVLDRGKLLRTASIADLREELASLRLTLKAEAGTVRSTLSALSISEDEATLTTEGDTVTLTLRYGKDTALRDRVFSTLSKAFPVLSMDATASVEALLDALLAGTSPRVATPKKRKEKKA